MDDWSALIKRLRRQITLLRVALALSVFAVLAFIFLYLNENDSIFASSQDLVVQLIPNLLAAVIAFIAGLLILDQIGLIDLADHLRSIMSVKDLKGFYVAHRDVPWGDVYENAITLDIGVFYYKHLPKMHFNQLVEFFRRGGKMRLLLIDPDNAELLKVVGEHFFKGMTPDQLSRNVHDSAELYMQAFKLANSRKADLQVWYFSKLFHYTFTYVDKTHIYISPYGQFEFEPQILSPVTVIDVSSNKALRDYWENQIKHFFKNAHKATHIAEDDKWRL